MLKLMVLHEALELFPDTRIDINISSNLWDFNNLKGSYSLPLNIPTTAKNKRLFGYPRLTTGRASYHNCIIYMNGLFFKSGQIEILDIENDYYSITIFFDLSMYNDKIYNKLNEIDIYGGDKSFDWTTYSPYSPDVSEFALPKIKNYNYFSWFNFNIVNETHDVDSIKYRWLVGTNNRTYYPVVPMPYLSQVLAYILDYLDLNTDENFFDGEELQKLIIINNKEMSDIDDTFDEGEQWYTYYYNEITSYNLKNHMPDISIAKFLKAIRAFFGVTLLIVNGKIIIKTLKSVLASSAYTDITNKASTAHKKIIVEAPQKLKLNWSRDEESLWKDLVISEINENYSIVQNESQLPASPEPNSLCLVESETLGAQNHTAFYYKSVAEQTDIYTEVSWYTLENIEKLSDNDAISLAQNYFTDYNPDLEIELNVAPIFGEFGSSISTPLQKLNLLAKNKRNPHKPEIELRLAFSKIIAVGQGGWWSTHKGDTFSLDLCSTKGIYVTYWYHLWTFLKNLDTKIEKEILFSQKELMFFDFSRKFKIGNKLYFVDNLQYSMFLNGNFSVSKAVLIPVV